AVALGLIAINLTRPARAPSVQAQSPPPLTTSYLVAAHPLPAGTLIRDTDLAAKEVPVANLPANIFTDNQTVRTGLRGSLVRNYLDTGVAITTADVLRPRDRGFIASVLTAGNRAVSLPVDAVTGVAGLIWPGDRVDIILTQEMEKAAPDQHNLGETVL